MIIGNWEAIYSVSKSQSRQVLIDRIKSTVQPALSSTVGRGSLRLRAIGLAVICMILGATGLVIWQLRQWAIATIALSVTAGFVLLFAVIVRQFEHQEDQNAALTDATGSLRKSEARLRDFAEMASDWFWEQDAELRFTWGSGTDAMHEITEVSWMGQTRRQYAGGQQDDAEWSAHEADLAARRPFRNFHYRHVDTNGRIRHLSASGKPVYAGTGAFIGYRGTGSDVTAQVEADADLRRARDLAEAGSRAKSEFLATMSHELRTPLNAIIGFSGLFRDQTLGALNPRYIECASDIHTSGVHLLDLISGLLDLSRLEAGRYELHEQCVELELITRECARMLALAAKQAGVHVECLASLRGVLLSGDPGAVRQIMLNLIGNGLKFTKVGGSVSIGAQRSDLGGVSVDVTDTGIGIEALALERIFEPFFQVDTSASRLYGGVGLGLTICRKLMLLHGGSIEIDSKPDCGTTARVIFPKERVVG